MKILSLGLMLLLTLLQGCRSCWIVEPKDPIETVTRYRVEFHQYFLPGSFSATLDTENVTSQFAPTPVPKGISTMVRNAPFLGGESGTTGVHIGTRDNPGESVTHVSTGSRAHRFAVACKCVDGAWCGSGDEITFVPLNFAASPSPIDIPAGGGALNMTLSADRALTAPVVVKVSPHLLGSTTAPANHIRINGASPGALVPVTLSPGPPANFYVQSVSPGGFWLRLEADGAQVGSVTGVAH